jgi:hypothetical protein
MYCGKIKCQSHFLTFIVSEDFDAPNFGTRMRVKIQMNQIKELMEKKG